MSDPNQPQYGQQPPYGQQPEYGQQPQWGQPQYGGGQPPAGSPYGYGGGPSGPPPPNHLVWAILSTIFCCLPLGIVSIVFAAQVNSKWQVGDAVGAQESSRKARTFAIWAAVAGIVVISLYLVGFVLIASAGLDTSP